MQCIQQKLYGWKKESKGQPIPPIKMTKTTWRCPFLFSTFSEGRFQPQPNLRSCDSWKTPISFLKKLVNWDVLGKGSWKWGWFQWWFIPWVLNPYRKTLSKQIQVCSWEKLTDSSSKFWTFGSAISKKKNKDKKTNLNYIMIHPFLAQEIWDSKSTQTSRVNSLRKNKLWGWFTSLQYVLSFRCSCEQKLVCIYIYRYLYLHIYFISKKKGYDKCSQTKLRHTIRIQTPASNRIDGQAIPSPE